MSFIRLFRLLSVLNKREKSKTESIYYFPVIKITGGQREMKNSTKNALIELGSTVVVFVLEVWQKMSKRKDKKERK